jgi:hypothetical protein
MRLIIFLCLLLNLISNNTFSQTVQIGTGVDIPTSTLYSPVYRFSATSATTGSRANIVFTQAELSAAGITAGSVITSVAFNKTNVANFVTPATYKMYMANTTNTSLATTLTWAEVMLSHTEVYSSTAFNLPSAAGWATITLTTPFTYTGGSLEIANECTMVGNGGATDAFKWEYTSSTPTDKIVGVSSPTGAVLNGSVASYKFRPNIQITFTPASACTVPPIGGLASSSLTNSCNGENFVLNLTGNSTGSGQTYQWQSSLTGNAPWSNIGSANLSPSYITNQTTSTYYRCAVTCSGNTAYSDSVQVITPALVGGTFTINSALPTGGGNFASFAEAFEYIKCGINSPVVFNVAVGSGPYALASPLILNEIYGTSLVNTITINGNGETLSYNTTDANNRAAIVLNGTDHIIIDSLTMDVSAGTYGWGILFKSNADSNIIRKNTILNNTVATSTNYAGIVFSNSSVSATTAGENGNDNLIENNRIVGGYYGITLLGSGTTNLDSNNVIKNNSIEEFYMYGIYMSYQKDLVLKSNDIHRPTRTNSGSCYGVYATTGNIGSLIDGNRIYNTFGGQTASTSILYGIYLTSDGTAASPNKIINNLIYSNEGNGTHYGIYNSGAEYMQAYHNTIALDYTAATAGATYGLYQITSVNGIEFKNNIVYITRGGSGVKYCIYKSTAATAIASNNNVFYLGSAGSGAQSIGYQTSAQASLTDWQTASSQDGASTVADPLFANPSSGDYLFTNVGIGNLGTPVGVLKDINDSTRSLTSPDIGAYEYVAPLCVAPPTAGNATSSLLSVCIAEDFSLNLTNNSTGTGQTYKWQSSLTGFAPWTDVDIANTTPLKTITQTVSTYYRCAVTCSGNTVYSDSLQVTTPALVGGTFTINSALPTGGSNFTNFADAINYVRCGINAPVVFNVVTGSGSYAITSPLELNEIYGVSATNTITFNGNGETLSYNTSDANNRAAIVLNGADHIIFDSLIIDVSAGTYGYGIVFMNNADSNIVRKSTILNNTIATTLNYSGIVFSSSPVSPTTAGDNGNDNLIENNRIVGGYYGITLVGGSASNIDSNNVIRNNSIEDFYTYGIYSIYQKDMVLKSNNIHRPTRTSSSTCYGISSSTGNTGSLIDGNRIHHTFSLQTASTSAFYGIYSTSVGTAASPNKIINNLIYGNEGNGSHFGLYNSGAAYMQAYHNTIALDYTAATAGATAGFYQVTVANGIEFKNNIVYITRGGTGDKYCIGKSSAATPLVSNNNVFYLGSAGSGTQSIGYQTTAQTSLTDWQTATGQDAVSMVADPVFANPSSGDYLFTNVSIGNLGEPLGVLKDINDSTRSLTSPDIGAYEYVAPLCVAPPTAGTVTSTQLNVCTGEDFSLNLTGNSTGTGQTYKWQYSLTGNAPWTDVDIANTTPLKSITQSVSTYYRCAVTCSGNTVYSDSLQVTTPSLVSGIYTINSALPTGGSNFANFADAINFVRCGITAPVVFNVAVGSGPYAITTPLELNEIYGVSSANTITFNGNGETLSYNTTDANNRAAIVLNGADHIILDSLTIDVSAGTYGWGILFTSNADSNIIRKSTILNNTTATSNSYAGIVFSGSKTGATSAADNGSDNLIEYNRIVGGYYSITNIGSILDSDSNNIIRNNSIEDFYMYGIYALYQKNLIIKSNNIHRPTRTNSSTCYGINSSTGNLGILIEGNKIHNTFKAQTTGTSSLYGIYMSADGTAANPNKIINNLIYSNEGNGTHYGIYNTGAEYMQAYHNTIALDYAAATAGTTYGFYQLTNVNGIEFKNNIVYITRGGSGTKYCIYKSTAASPIVSNSNIFYLGSMGGGSQSVGYQGSAQPTLSDWQTASSQDANSVHADPSFANPSADDYKPTEVTIDNLGLPLGVTHDIEGVVRSLTTPDRGAYEFNSIVPVTYTMFTGKKEGSVNILSWQTATETNNTGFELQRSADGKEYSKLSFVNSKATNGNSNMALSYAYNDAKPLAGNNYYRLKQIDKDGKANYSNVVILKADKVNQIRIASVYPNPVRNTVNVQLVSPTNERVSLVITDITGKVLLQENTTLVAGDNIKQIDVSNLSQGSYLIKVKCTNGCENAVVKFVK